TQLLAIRVGPGAAILPKEVAKLNLAFSQHIDGGHRGPRKFWREMLPRLQYRNPGIPMTVTRQLDQSIPATLTIFYRQPATTAASSPSATPSGPRRVEKVIDIKGLSEAEILRQLLQETKATPCEPTEVELQEMRELEEQRERSKRDSERSLEVRRQRKKEEAMLKAARGEVLEAA
ncbi:hypothetical protein AOQ84DRAFT_284997, partial [Glonium stellatum]